MSNEIAAILYGLFVFVVICGSVIGFVAWLEKSSNDDMGWSEKEGKKLQAKAEKEVKRRPRLSVVRFWNV